MRSQKVYPRPACIQEWRNKALYWASQDGVCAYTNPNGQQFPFEPFREIIAAGAAGSIQPEKNKFDRLKMFHDQYNDWLFGYFGYDLKNEIEPYLFSQHKARTKHPDLYFFRPKHLIFIEEDQIKIESDGSPDKIFDAIERIKVPGPHIPQLNFTPSMTCAEYIEKVKKIINHILEGDIYELNFCMEFFATNVKINPVEIYLQLIRLSPTPFSGFLRQQNNYLMSASPERFLKKTGRKLISQPIKGTAKRSLNKITDEKLKTLLYNDEKERAENMMIVDLVRNDLARSSEPGSVRVEEIFGIYTFRQWHQMISTVSAVARQDIHWVDILRNAFPMGSMTGAPKITVMERIERYENIRRGVYSGAFGYITPDGDFDFNVVIRSLAYSEDTGILNFQTGSALTYDAIPEKEYEECLLKASAIFQLFNSMETEPIL